MTSRRKFIQSSAAAIAGAAFVSKAGAASLPEAPEEKTAEWQNRINYIWPHISGGCNLNKDIPHLIGKAGFNISNMEQMYLPKTPKILGYNYWGTAIKAD